jgi:hypothetical protein
MQIFQSSMKELSRRHVAAHGPTRGLRWLFHRIKRNNFDFAIPQEIRKKEFFTDSGLQFPIFTI